jgi:hypothetical protein
VVEFSCNMLKNLPKTKILILHLSTFGNPKFDKIVLKLLKMAEGVEELKILIDSPEVYFFSVSIQCIR